MTLTRRGDRRSKSAVSASSLEVEGDPGTGGATPAPTESVSNQEVIDALVRRDVLTADQFDHATIVLSDQDIDLGQALVGQDIIDEQTLTDVRAEVRGLSTVDLRIATPESEALALLPESTAREHVVLPMTLRNGTMTIGWATQDELRRLAEKQGMRTLRQEAISLVAQDVTTVSEVIRSIYAL